MTPDTKFGVRLALAGGALGVIIAALAALLSPGPVGLFSSFRQKVPFFLTLGTFLAPWLWLFLRALKAQRLLRLIAPPGILLGAVVLFILGRDQIPIAERYRLEGVRIKGAVTNYQPRNHNSLSYEYRVGNQLYSGGDFAPVDCGDLEVGDSVPIVYLRSAPDVSAARVPTDTTGSVLLSALIGAAWLGTGAVNLGYYGNRRRRQPPTIRLERAV